MSGQVTGPLRITPLWWLLRGIVVFLARILFRWRVRVEGLEHVPRDSGAVVVYNHHSYFDFVMVAYPIVRKVGRPLRFLAKAEIWDSWKVRWIMNGAQAVPVHRSSQTGRQGALATAVEALEAGDLVAVAPEQTISQSFELLPMTTGAVRMAQAAGVPIIPVAGWGTHRFLTKGRGVQWPGRLPVTVHYGEPLHIDPGEHPRAATDRLAARLGEMLDAAQRTYPDGTPADAWWVPARLGGGAPTHDEVLAAHEQRRSAAFEQRRDAERPPRAG